MLKLIAIGVGILIVLAALFGKRIRKLWEYEAEFRDASGREIGEFEIEKSKIEKEEPDYSLKVEFHLRHEAIAPASTIQVFVEDVMVLEGTASDAGFARLGDQHLRNEVDEPLLGKQARVLVEGQEIVSEALVRD